MTHSEFKRRISEYGFRVRENINSIRIIYADNLVAWVSKIRVNLIDTSLSGIVNEELREKLFYLLFEYATTPIQQRSNEKRYSLYPLWADGRRLIRYEDKFRENGYGDLRTFGLSYFRQFSKNEITVFSESEVRKICDLFAWKFDEVAKEVVDDEQEERR